MEKGTVYYLCRDGRCMAPVETIEKLDISGFIGRRLESEGEESDVENPLES